MRTRRPNPGTAAFRRYSTPPPPGASITAYDSTSPTATPARRYPGGACSGVAVGVGVLAATVGVGVAAGAAGRTPATRQSTKATLAAAMKSRIDDPKRATIGLSPGYRRQRLRSGSATGPDTHGHAAPR